MAASCIPGEFFFGYHLTKAIHIINILYGDGYYNLKYGLLSWFN